MKKEAITEMVQGDLFAISSATHPESKTYSGELLPMPEANVRIYEGFFNQQESDDFFQTLLDEIKWRQDKMNIYGKEVNLPRKTAWYGDNNRKYKFSGIQLEPEPWTPSLLEIKARIEAVADISFNSVLLNLYRDGNDGISWHTDAESELGKNPVIGSVSFGGTRKFSFKHKNQKDLKQDLELTHGSFLLMSGTTQHFWLHQIPKTKKKVNPRINLTFRVIYGS